MKTAKLLFDVLPPGDRRKLIILFAAVVLMGLVEVVGLATLGPFFTALTEPQQLLRSGLTADVADRLGLTTQRQLVLTFGLFALAAIAFRSALSGITMYKLLRWAYAQTHSLAQQLLHAYAFQPYLTFTQQNAGDLAKNVLMEVQSVINGVVVPAINLYAYSIVGIFVITFLAVIDPPLALLLGGSMALFYAPVVVAARRRMAKIGLERLTTNQQRSRSATELLAGIKEIKAAGAEGAFLRRFNKPSERFSRLTAISQIVAQSPRYAFELVVIASLILVAIYLSSGEHQSLLPTLALFAFGAYRLMPILQQAFAALTSVRFNTAALELLHKDLSSLEGSELVPNGDRPQRLDMRSRLSVKDVSLSFLERDRAALRGVSLEIPAGSVVGIVGATGSGKSSLLDVMMGLIEPDEGEVWCDDVRLVDPADFARFRSSIGYVSQRVFLFDASVAENVSMTADLDQRDSDLERACRIAQIDDFIRRELPNGYETHVGFEGSRLSGGQRQRIGLARAMFREPSLLILDEATSQLDTETEQRVFEGIRVGFPHMTVVMVSHRLSTLEHCDVLFEMEAGRLAQAPLSRLGSHVASPSE